ncbi:MAG: YaiO family outer membrane beta-barrel protein [Bryobacterales bacterium]|nr:YaiO family outer membrane beta-barrel protein [Bryobacterales bacterium]
MLSALWVPLGMADDAVERARVLAAGKDRAEALALLASRLSEEPGDLDARTLTGTILSWEGRYAEARGQLEAVLEAEPGHGDATLALIHLELWSGNGARAEQLANKAVASRPDSAPYQAVLERVQRERRPESEDERPAIKWQAGVERSYIWFSDTQESWRESKVSANVETRAGLVAVHASQAARGRLIDRIVELEMYPRLSRKSYAHIVAGFSPDATLYARRRYGAEVYHALPARFEGSVGFRQYVFGERVDLVTGSIGRYYGNWFFSARPFIDRSSFGISQSLQLNAKRYLGRRGSFWNTRAGWGASPMEVRSINEAGIRSSLSFFQDLNLLLPNGFQLRLSGGVATQNRRDRGALRQYGLSGTLLYGF